MIRIPVRTSCTAEIPCRKRSGEDSVLVLEFCPVTIPQTRHGRSGTADHTEQKKSGEKKQNVQFGIEREFTAEDFLFGQVAPEVNVLHLKFLSHHEGIGVGSETVKRGAGLFYESFSHGLTIPFDKIAAETTVVLYQKTRLLSILGDRHNLVDRQGKFKILPFQTAGNQRRMMIFHAASVFSVTEQRRLSAPELNADLVRPSGLRINEKFRDGNAVHVEYSGGLIGENRFLRAFSGMFRIHDVRLVVIAVEKEHIAQFAFGRKGSIGGHKGGVRFMETAVGNDFRQIGGGFFIARIDHKSCGRPVESMNGIEFIRMRLIRGTECLGNSGGTFAFGQHPAGFIDHDKVAGNMEDIDHSDKKLLDLNKVYLIIYRIA